MNEFDVVSCIVEHDGKFLIIEEGKPGREGLFNFPGGHVEIHETYAEAAIRETHEESGYEVELVGIVGFYQNIMPGLNICGPVFYAKMTGGQSRPTKHHPSVTWRTYEEILLLHNEKKLFTTYPVPALEKLKSSTLIPLDVVHTIRTS